MEIEEMLAHVDYLMHIAGSKEYIKIADSLRDLFMDSQPIWYKDS